MSSQSVHLQQASHNKRLAEFIHSFRLPFRDWVVTATFYSAVHIAEALFFVLSPRGVQHSETSRPRGHRGGFHGWRKDLVEDLVRQNKLSKYFLFSYTNLHSQSEISRYLILPAPNSPKTSLNKTSYEYFSRSDIKSFLDEDLAIIYRESLAYLTFPKFDFLIYFKSIFAN